MVLQRVFDEVWRHDGRSDPSTSLPAWVSGVDGRELAERRARCDEVRDALNRLPGEQREVLVLAYFGGFTQSEIATYLGVPLGTVKARSFQGLRRLAELLSRSQ